MRCLINTSWSGEIHIDNDIVTKYFKEYSRENLKRELEILHTLARYDISPKIISSSETKILMEYVGEPINENNIPTNWRNQIEHILRILECNDISHNDIKQEELLVKDGTIRICDFGWATPLNKKKPEKWPQCIGKFKDYDAYNNDRYSMYHVCNSLTNMPIHSSYIKNNIGKTLTEVAKSANAKKIVEFGTLHGYSAMALAEASPDAEVISYDLWDLYKFNRADKTTTQKIIENNGFSNQITLRDGNLFDWLETPETFDLLHIDISNDGHIIELVVKKLKDFITSGSVILFEGGTEERDNIEWMKKYNKKPLCSVKEKVKYTVIANRFPGLSIIGREL